MLHNSGYALRFVYQIVEASCLDSIKYALWILRTHEIAYLLPVEHRRRDMNDRLLSHQRSCWSHHG